MRERARLPFPSEWFDDRGYFPGARIAPRSISASRISLDALSDLIADLGEVTSGTFIAGRLGAGRVIIGDQGDGIQMRDAAERTVMTMTTSGRLRIGYADSPGIDMWDGLLDMHGGAIRAGTITADKMDVGELAAGMLRSDAILVGDGNPADLSTVTGAVITRDYLGGRNNGVPTVYFDPLTGHLVSFREDDATRLTYSAMAGGQLELNNYFEPAATLDQALAAGVRFRSHVLDDLTGAITVTEMTLVGVRDALYMIRASAAGGPALRMVDTAGTEYVTLSQQGLRMIDGASSIVLGRSLAGGNIDLMQEALDTPLRMGAIGSAVLSVAPGEVAIIGGWLAFAQEAGHAFPETLSPAESQMGLWANPTTRELWWWDGTGFTRVRTEAIA